MLQSTVRSSKSLEHRSTASSSAGNNKDDEALKRRASLQRVLPTTEHTRDNLFGRHNEDINEFYKVVHQEYVILAEYEMVMSENLKGIYVIPSNESSFIWFGVIFVRSGLFEDGIFRFSIVLPETFPESQHPKVVFQSQVFHPVIDSNTNELYLLNGFPTWNRSEQHIWQILKYIKWIFYNFEASLSHGIDRELIDLYKNNAQAFTDKAKTSVKQSVEHLYDSPDSDDKHYISFEPYNKELHDPVVVEMLQKGTEARTKVSGHSWVMRGNFKPLSRPPSPDSDDV